MSSDEWELAALGNDAFAKLYGEKEDVEAVLAESTSSDIEAP
jgi:hypothetical protein